MTTPRIAVTMGDPGGIGPEVVLKALEEVPAALRKRCVLYGVPGPFEKVRRKFPKLAFPFPKTGPAFIDIAPGEPGRPARFDPAKVSRRNAALAMESLRQAADAALGGEAGALVTAPVSKTAMRRIDPGFHGHTEYLAARAGVKSFAMMFVSPRLRVTLVTIHEPLRKVASLITAAGIEEKIRLTHDFLKRRCRIAVPRIAVCALNPHGRETGTEENTLLRPAVLRARRGKIRVSGPFSADQLFYEAYRGRYDALISMYHDQALAPFKMVAFHEGVNVTLGLPFVRTSPDHGTAFDIAYRGQADPSSMAAALVLAARCLRP